MDKNTAGDTRHPQEIAHYEEISNSSDSRPLNDNRYRDSDSDTCALQDENDTEQLGLDSCAG